MDQYTMRQIISAALTEEGPPGKDRLAADPAASMMRPGVELPGGAVLVRFDSFPHSSASFYAGVVGRRVFHLTETPKAFSTMVRESGVRIASTDIAVGLARGFVESTRSMREFSRVVDSARDITWAQPRSREEQQTLADAGDRVQALIRPPVAVAAGDGYEVTLYVLRGSTLERRVLTIARDGEIAEHVEVVASGLPTPISM
jgi:hypothetical protein